MNQRLYVGLEQIEAGDSCQSRIFQGKLGERGSWSA